jgi:hypothetical protein
VRGCIHRLTHAHQNRRIAERQQLHYEVFPPKGVQRAGGKFVIR